MIYITKEQWEKIPEDYKGKSIFDKKAKVCFAAFLENGGGTALLYEHKHFEIVKD